MRISSYKDRLRTWLDARPWRQRFLRWLVFFSLVGATASGVIGGGIYLYYAPTVPAFRSIDDYQPYIGTRIYSADNQLIGEFAAERRVLVPVEQIPQQLLNAFVAAEDKRFYSHGGIDVIGVTQAILDKVLHPASKLRGASTITQQVAKSLLVSHESYAKATERSLVRKIREAILAFRLEQTLSKDEIVYMYVTQIFLGHKAYGVQAAAEHYFRKNVWELSLAEMATLAGLPQRPSDYSPVSRPEAAAARRRYVLSRMYKDDYITKEERDKAMQEVIVVHPRRELYLQIAPYYTEQVRREIVARYGERALLEDGLKVYTAMNMGFQNTAQRALTRGLMDLDRRQGFRGPLVHLAKADKRQTFMTLYRRELNLQDGEELQFEDSTAYLALVKKVEPELVTLDIAGRPGLLPLAAMRWARKPDPTQRVDKHYVEDARRVLKAGDVIRVMPTTRAKLAKDRYGWEILESVPKDAEFPFFKLLQEPIAQAALMSVDPQTGYVTAQVGGYNFEESNFNRAIQACREPGSAFKPIVYSAAIDKLDFSASTLVEDKPIIFDDPDNAVRWKPNNAGMEFRGALPLRTCLMDSINTPAIRIAEAVGIEDLIKNARNLGVSSPLKRELGTAIGSSCTTLGNLMNVYVTLDRYGRRQPLHFITRVVDRDNHVLYDVSASVDPTIDFGSRLDRAYDKLISPGARALDEQSAFLTVSLMRNVIEHGTGIGASRLGTPVAGKTGTTNDSYDAWFMGFTPKIVTGVWVGHDKKERPLGVSEQGGRTALPIWVDYMAKALKDNTVFPPKTMSHGDFSPPVGVVRVAIDPDTGLLARPKASRVALEWYRAGNQPTERAPDQNVLNPEQVDIWGADTPL
ncbi:MAG: PBP1A family penicillin-binding protein [Myxococcota bacterium]